VEVLEHLGFNIQLLGSEKYVLNKLQSLSEEQIQTIREAFIRHSHARFMKYFFCHIPFGKKEAYAKELMKARASSLNCKSKSVNMSPGHTATHVTFEGLLQ
jgi:hypothetical protein